jgi:hypothetical protein
MAKINLAVKKVFVFLKQAALSHPLLWKANLLVLGTLASLEGGVTPPLQVPFITSSHSAQSSRGQLRRAGLVMTCTALPESEEVVRTGFWDGLAKGALQCGGTECEAIWNIITGLTTGPVFCF